MHFCSRPFHSASLANNNSQKQLHRHDCKIGDTTAGQTCVGMQKLAMHLLCACSLQEAIANLICDVSDSSWLVWHKYSAAFATRAKVTKCVKVLCHHHQRQDPAHNLITSTHMPSVRHRRCMQTCVFKVHCTFHTAGGHQETYSREPMSSTDSLKSFTDSRNPFMMACLCLAIPARTVSLHRSDNSFAADCCVFRGQTRERGRSSLSNTFASLNVSGVLPWPVVLHRELP